MKSKVTEPMKVSWVIREVRRASGRTVTLGLSGTQDLAPLTVTPLLS